jgi:glutathione-specific gamma-glutamylcyclotransferase
MVASGFGVTPLRSDEGEQAPLAIDSAEQMPAEIAALCDGARPVWIFVYGSLLWDPEFSCAEAEPALLHGYHRSFCLYSYDYRGTPERPGLVLGLDRGGSCRGLACRLPPQSLAEAMDRVWLREMSGRRVYEMRLLPVRIGCGIRRAFAFTVLRNCPDYAGRLPLDDAAQIILGAAGGRGTCRDYFENTLRHLEQLGLADLPLRRLAERVEALAGPAQTAARSVTDGPSG